MAKYNVKFSCGHTEEIQLFGKGADRQRKITWLEEHGECSSCYKARLAAAHAAETAAAAAKAEEEKLPELTGSEKQVNWAISIRAKKMADLDKMLTGANDTDHNRTAIQAAKLVLLRQTQSKFWIDNRNVAANRLISTNNLQDELKNEFARLSTETAETAETAEVVDAPEVDADTEAQEVALAGEEEGTLEMTTAERFLTRSYNCLGSRITSFATQNEATAWAKAEVTKDKRTWVEIIHGDENGLTVIDTVKWHTN